MQALILAGGSGTRFWPLSRRTRPKQLLALEGEAGGAGDRTLLQETVERIRPLIPPQDVWVCHHRALAGEVRRQLPEVPAAQVLAEPLGRNTAPAIGWAVRSMPEAAAARRHRGAPRRPPGGRRRAPSAPPWRAPPRSPGATTGCSTLGVVPRWAETGYGYLELGEPLAVTAGVGEGDVRRVVRFVEKPTAERAAGTWPPAAISGTPASSSSAARRFLDHLSAWSRRSPRGLEAIAADPGRARRALCRAPRRFDRLRRDGEARRHRHGRNPAARLRLERPRLLGGARRGAAAGRRRQRRAGRRGGRRCARQPAVRRRRRRSPSWGSRGWWWCAPATPCWCSPRSARRTSASSSPSSQARGRKDLL